MKAFECKGCSTIIFIKRNVKEPLWCPVCRTSMAEIKSKSKDRSKRKLKKYRCPECEYEFLIDKNSIPYKCANCNYTFTTTFGKLQEERL
jgi:transposase-like protein